jgi:hypothetical protein
LPPTSSEFKWIDYNYAVSKKAGKLSQAMSAFSSDDGVPRTTRAVVAYFDILGFTEEMKRAARQGRSDEFLQKVTSTLKGWYSVARGDVLAQPGRHRYWEVKAFTDNVVIGHPIGGRGDAESELGHVMSGLASLQLGLVLQSGLFIRGGVAIGELYMDDDIVYGVGLLDAVAEEKIADAPRVLLHPTAVHAVRQHFRYYGPVARAPQARHLLRDEDGQIFLNYLADTWDDSNDSTTYEWLARHRDIVAGRLHEYRREPRVWSKYAWVARYHNYFCSSVPGGDAYALDVTLLSLDARRMDQVFRNRPIRRRSKSLNASRRGLTRARS